MTNPIPIRHSDAFRVRFEHPGEMPDSFLKETYDKVFHLISDIQKRSDLLTAKDSESANVIALTGNRGSGKSSALVSIADALTKVYEDNEPLLESLIKLRSEKNKRGFLKLKTIDPTMFHGDESIVEVMVALMFEEFRNGYRSSGVENDAPSDVKELYEAFDEVFSSMKAIDQDKGERSKQLYNTATTFQVLSKLALGPSLRDNIAKLVSLYLKWMKGEVLLVAIDDLDLQLDSPIGHLESIRKYLCVKGIIVLIGVRVEQLLANVEQYYFGQYKDLIGRGRLFEDPREMAHKYLEKLIPQERRVPLPDLALGEDAKRGLTYIGKNDAEHHFTSLKDAVVEFTFKKTGIRIVPELYFRHPLIPPSLRYFHDYFVFLEGLEDYDGEGLSKEDKLNSLNLFEDFLINKWGLGFLHSILLNFARQWRLIPNKDKNKYFASNALTELTRFFQTSESAGGKSAETIWQAWGRKNEELYKDFTVGDPQTLKISRKIQVNFDKESGTKEEDFNWLEITNRGNNPENVSIGDVLLLLNLIATNCSNSLPVQQFVFLMRALYSILFSKELLSDDPGSRLKTLVGPSIFEPESIALIRAGAGQELRYRSHFIFEYNVAKRTYDNQSGRKKVAWELFNLFLSYGRYLADFRARERSFSGPYDTNIKYAFFNLLSLPANLLDWRAHIKGIGGSQEVIEILEKGGGIYHDLFPLNSLERLEAVLFEFKKELKKEFKSSTRDGEYFEKAINILDKLLGGQSSSSRSVLNPFIEYMEELKEIYEAAYLEYKPVKLGDQDNPHSQDSLFQKFLRGRQGEFRWYSEHRIHWNSLLNSRRNLIEGLKKLKDGRGIDTFLENEDKLWNEFGENGTWQKNQYVQGILNELEILEQLNT